MTEPGSQPLPVLKPQADRAAPAADSGLEARAVIMMIDDESTTLDVLQAFLEDAGYRRFVATSEPADAMALAASERPDVVLLDLMMPVVSGFEILRAIRASEKLGRIPVVVLTSSTDAGTKLKALELGATDFLAKPVDASELVLRLRNILAAKAYVDRVTHFDRMTGLYNREMFLDHLDWCLRQARRYKRSGALLHINIDRFKQINDALGPALGDELLKGVASRVDQCIRASDTVGLIDEGRDSPSVSRLGSDEFAVLLAQVERVEGIVLIAKRVLDALGAPFALGDRELFVTCSIGISVFPPDGMDRNVLLQNAAVALHQAKQRGGNNYCFHSGELNDRSLRYLNLHSELRRGIERGEFRLAYQPKFETKSRRLVGAEALLRWKHPERGVVSPMEFIPVAEETGLIVQIGGWVFAEACRQLEAWRSAGLDAIKVAVNISGRQFREGDFLQSIKDSLARSRVDPRRVQIELTESILMEKAAENIAILGELRGMGLQISIDDFGTGYSSLSYLSRFPLDELKIDRSFLSGIGADAGHKGASIVDAIIALAHSLGLSVVAEGVETEAQWKFLLDRGCEECQGYWFGRPVTPEEFADSFLRGNAAHRGGPPA